MKRREFITVLGGAAATWPLAARGQQAAMPVIGFLHSGSPEPSKLAASAFLQGLSEAGFSANRNVAIEYRWAQDRNEQLPALAAELVRHPVDVLLAAGGQISARSAKAATSITPVVFVIAADPVEIGLVASLNRPGGNITGVANFSNVLITKRLELLRELIPGASVIGFLQDTNSPGGDNTWRTLEEAARAVGQQMELVKAGTERELDAAFEELTRRKIGALVIQNTPLFLNQRDRVIALAAQHRIPTSYERPEAARAGGLISYGSSFADSNRQAGLYVGRILKGEKPADLPVILPTKFELVVNLKTARTLGLTIPESFLLRADEVIE
jgi:putative ABC transport system substrate-binding protein